MARKSNGQFKPGSSGNPLGRPATGFQSAADRIQYWAETKTVGEIETLVRDKKNWRRLVQIDAMICRRLDEAQKKTGIQDMRILFEYWFGKPVQPIAAEFKVTHGLAERIEKARGRIAGLASPIALFTSQIIEQSVEPSPEDPKGVDG